MAVRTDILILDELDKASRSAHKALKICHDKKPQYRLFQDLTKLCIVIDAKIEVIRRDMHITYSLLND